MFRFVKACSRYIMYPGCLASYYLRLDSKVTLMLKNKNQSPKYHWPVPKSGGTSSVCPGKLWTSSNSSPAMLHGKPLWKLKGFFKKVCNVEGWGRWQKACCLKGKCQQFFWAHAALSVHLVQPFGSCRPSAGYPDYFYNGKHFSALVCLGCWEGRERNTRAC